ncbi:cysteine protease family C01A [Achlya hypogyna]|uniref:Cysteine protease family C01A n=1 Tax=Achlya hypogyna TaxID=1202772 RepID=A0A0A7CPU7_ACHHY|nr:secreted protein [Achlya hypogyna]OQR80863.1 cysteine protease family C01A [Achlya hypogyna]
MHPFVLAATLATAAALNVSPAERTQLTEELTAWTEAYGEAHLPEGVNPSDTDALLARLHASKAAITALQAAQPSATFHLGRFGLYTLEEFNAFIAKSFGKGPVLSKEVAEVSPAGVGAANGTVDWSATKCMNPVQDQGECSSAWVFSTTAAVEAAHCIATGTPIDVSEQDIVSCDRDLVDDGCKGGLEFTAIDWITKGGICLAKDYPYTSGVDGKNGQCQTTCTKQKLAIQSYKWAVGEPKMETTLQTQPLTVSVEAGNYAWMFYKGGVLTTCPGNEIDHTAVAVGYGSENGVNYFKIRNSWGVSWGEQGHIRLLRGVGDKGMCNVAEFPIYPVIKGTPAPTTVAPTTKPAC